MGIIKLYVDIDRTSRGRSCGARGQTVSVLKDVGSQNLSAVHTITV